MMRIITGKARGTALATLAGDATRPTAERAKEALFSMLQFELHGMRVLDLFGGSGQIALEALSRGAAFAYICDSAEDACKIIRKNIAKTRLTDCTLLCCDYKKALAQLRNEQFDFVFLDPPYRLGLIPDALERIASYGMIRPGGYLVCEDERQEPYTCPGFSLHKHTSYGRIHLTVLKKESKHE